MSFKNIVLLLSLFCLILSAKLPPPNKTGGTPLYEAALNRQSKRDFTDTPLTDQEMSQILWAGYGINDVGHRTVPSSKGCYADDVYAFTKEGIYFYKPETHELELKLEGDYRNVTGDDDYITKAGVNFCFIGVFDREPYPSEYDLKRGIRYDTAFITDAMYFACVSEGLKCVVRGKLDQTKILRVLGLGEEDYHVSLCFSAGK
ncbi:MAG: SagB/ThcOx family dehydrogenase [archaeon]|nr:SagB/ThcOx family dehydrogenase [archaeon]